jgi:hypothetical protein
MSIGIIIGNPRMAIRLKLLLLFEAIAETIVRAVEKDADPITMLKKKKSMSCTIFLMNKE